MNDTTSSNTNFTGYFDEDATLSPAESVAINYPQKFVTLVWINRCSGMLSLLGSALIVADVLLRRWRATSVATKLTVYHELMLAMSFYDMNSSIMFALGSTVLPSENSDGSPSFYYNAKGNDATCTAQGWFFEFGNIGSATTNLMLSLYYVLVIVYGYSDHRLHQGWRKWLFGIPLLLALAFSCAIIPFVKPVGFICTAPFPPLHTDSWALPLVFSILPFSVVLLLAHVNMGLIVHHVRRQAQATDKWRSKLESYRNSSTTAEQPSSNSNNSNTVGENQNLQKKKRKTTRTERAVFWSAVFYLLAMLFTWLPLLLSFPFQPIQQYGWIVVMVLLPPLQGFWNAMIYFRPKLVACCQKNKKATTSKSSTRTNQKEQAEIAVTKDEDPSCLSGADIETQN